VGEKLPETKKNKKQEQLNLNFLQWIFPSKAEIAGNKEKS
jgi:hypothetical protein